MKVVKKIKKIFLWILAIVFFVFVILMTILLLNFNKFGVTQINDTSLIMIRDHVSSNNYKKGDLIFVKSKKIGKIEKGKELFAYKLDDKGGVTIDFGIVDKISVKDDAISFENGATYSMKFVIGTSSKVYENVGTYLSIIESKWGFFLIVLVPSFFILLYQVYALIIEIKYGSDEDLEPEKKSEEDKK